MSAIRGPAATPGVSLPSGTVTFAFTDIEGSSQRWERDRAAMRDALRRHDALVRTTIARHGGYVFKTVGDAFCCAFSRPEDAVAAMLDAQRAMAGSDFSAVGGLLVRAAIHTGTADERDGDYFGPTLNRVARLLAIGHGGQVLVSGATSDLVQGALPAMVALRHLGEYRLKDLGLPEQVYQLLAPGLAADYPPLRSLKSLLHNFPIQLSSFVGRAEVVDDVARLVNNHRLVTLTGPGGVGKTRVALEVAGDVLDDWPDGAWLVELAPLSDGSLVVGEVAAAVGLRPSAGPPAQTALLTFLKSRQLLIVLDNCEHVLAEAAMLADAILRTCPLVSLLATSREALGIIGEEVYSMPSLSVPPLAPPVTTETVLAFDAAALLVERARAVDKRFELTEANAPVVVEIVRRLDGIPLAIELAAARMKTLGVLDLAKRLNRKLSLLTGGSRAVLPRQQTMRALIDWSYDLLPELEKKLLRRLSTFAGGFTLDSVVQLCAHDAIAEPTAVDLLTSLVEKSLVQMDSTEAGVRYRLLESTSEYARDKLVEQGERQVASRAHASAYLVLAQAFDATWSTTPERKWLREVRPELENWRAALEWSLAERGDELLGQWLIGSLQRVSSLTVPERRRWLTAAREALASDTPQPVVARLDLCEAQISATLFQWKIALPAAERALAAFRELGDLLLTAEAQRYVGYALVRLGNTAEGEVSLQAALEAYRELNAQRATAWVLQDIADARNVTGDIAGARPLYAEALQLYRGTGAEERATSVARNLAEAEFRAGDVATALRLANEALAADREEHDPRHLAHDLINMGAYLIADGRIGEANACTLEALALARSAEIDIFATIALQHLAAVAALAPGQDVVRVQEDNKRAARLIGYVDARLASLGVQRSYTEQQEYDKIANALRRSIGSDEIVKLMQEGSRWSDDHAVLEGAG